MNKKLQFSPTYVKKKIQFSKFHVVFADLLVLYVYTVSAVLTYYDKAPISDVAIAVISVYGAFATGGYFTLCGVRDCSLNKLNSVLAKGENTNG